MGLLRIMEESWVFLGSSGGSIRVMGILPKLGHLFPSMEVYATVRGLFCSRWSKIRVRGLFGPSESNGRVMGLLGVQWWQHQSNHNSTEVRAPFSFYGSLGHLFPSILPQLGDFFVDVGEM